MSVDFRLSGELLTDRDLTGSPDPGSNGFLFCSCYEFTESLAAYSPAKRQLFSNCPLDRMY